MVQPQVEESLEAHIPSNGGQRKDGLTPTHRSDLGPNAKPMVAVHNGWAVTRGGAKVGLASALLNLISIDPMRDEPSRNVDRKEDARSSTNHDSHTGEFSHHQGNPNFQADPRVQLTLSSVGTRDGCARTSFDTHFGHRSVEGNDDEDQMESEDGSKVAPFF